MSISLRIPLAAALTAALLGAPATAGAASAPHHLQSAVDRVVDAGAPGAIAFADGHTAVAGVADLRSGRPLRASDRIRIGSVTKSFTAVVALQLVGEGRLRLGDTVGSRLPGVFPSANRVTLRQLLNHTSGTQDDVLTPLLGVFEGNPLRVWSPAEVLALTRDRPLLFPPGTGWAYSSTDYTLVGLMIEQATGRSLEQEVRARILRPLRLRDTRFPVRASRLGHRASRGYSLGPDGGGPLRDVSVYSPSFAWAAGNGVSDVDDIARFYAALLGGRLLRPALLREALRTVDTGQPGRRYGLGIEARKSPFGTLIGHEGDILGFSIKALSSRDGRRQAIVAVNEKFATDAVDHAFDAAEDAAVRAAFRH
jgi:D-alanyl-D-alanine carboxypeptidase